MTSSPMPLGELEQTLAGIVESALLARHIAATASEAGHSHAILRYREDDPSVLELSIADLDEEADLVGKLSARYGPSRELTHNQRRVHVWVVQQREIVLQAEAQSLIIIIHPAGTTPAPAGRILWPRQPQD